MILFTCKYVYVYIKQLFAKHLFIYFNRHFQPTPQEVDLTALVKHGVEFISESCGILWQVAAGRCHCHCRCIRTAVTLLHQAGGWSVVLPTKTIKITSLKTSTSKFNLKIKHMLRIYTYVHVIYSFRNLLVMLKYTAAVNTL